MSPDGCALGQKSQSKFSIFQATRTPFPVSRPSGGVAQGDARHGRRARNEGTGTSLRDGPRSNTGRREPRQSRGRMSGWPSLWLLSLGQTRESDSAGGPKPEVSAHSVSAVITEVQLCCNIQYCQSGVSPIPHKKCEEPLLGFRKAASMPVAFSRMIMTGTLGSPLQAAMWPALLRVPVDRDGGMLDAELLP